QIIRRIVQISRETGTHDGERRLPADSPLPDRGVQRIRREDVGEQSAPVVGYAERGRQSERAAGHVRRTERDARELPHDGAALRRRELRRLDSGVQRSGGLRVRRRGSKTQKKRGASDTHHRAVSGFHESPRQKGATSQVGAIWNRGAVAALEPATAPPPQLPCRSERPAAPFVLVRYWSVLP